MADPFHVEPINTSDCVSCAAEETKSLKCQCTFQDRRWTAQAGQFPLTNARGFVLGWVKTKRHQSVISFILSSLAHGPNNGTECRWTAKFYSQLLWASDFMGYCSQAFKHLFVIIRLFYCLQHFCCHFCIVSSITLLLMSKLCTILLLLLHSLCFYLNIVLISSAAP